MNWNVLSVSDSLGIYYNIRMPRVNVPSLGEIRTNFFGNGTVGLFLWVLGLDFLWGLNHADGETRLIWCTGSGSALVVPYCIIRISGVEVTLAQVGLIHFQC